MNQDPRFILTILVLLGILAVCFSQDYQQLYDSCKQPLTCGGLQELTYPFWVENRREECGYPGFELTCDNDVLRVNISSVPYRVLEIDYNTRTLKVARDDLWNDQCPTHVFNTSLNPDLFDFYPKFDDQSIALYYGCTFNNQAPLTPFPNQFNCNVNGSATWSFFQYPITDISRVAPGIVCLGNITLRVNQTAATNLQSPPTTANDLFQSALRSGFWIQWAVNRQEDCNKCVRSGGLCGRNLESGTFACYCSGRPHHSTCNGSEQGLSAMQKYVIIGAAICSVGILLSGLIIYYIRKKSRSLRKMDQKNNHGNVEEFLVNYKSLAPKRYSYNDIKRITKSFSDKIGEGGYGIVYKGWLPDSQIVAVKVLAKIDNTGEEFINEVASISKTSHVNIVNLLGFCYDRKRRALIYEFMPNESLDKFIYKKGQNDLERHLDWNKLYDIAVGVARGLEYLHRGCNTRIIHFDIKPHNILLDKDFCPKISDFGLAKLFKKDQSIISVLGTRGTIGYIAPEMFSRNFGAVSHKSDVYSYGMVLLEMAGSRKFDEIEATQSSEDYFFDKIYELTVVNRNKLKSVGIAEENEETARKMLMVGLWCVQTAPSDRPSMTKVVEMLQGRFESIEIPSKPLFSPPELSSFSIDVVTEN